MQTRIFFLVTCLYITCLSDGALAQANAAQSTAPLPETAQPSAGSANQSQAATVALPKTKNDKPTRDEDPMAKAGIGLKIGYLNLGRGSYEQEVLGEKIRLEIPSRDGVTISIPINLGGSGFGWIFEPYLGVGKELKSIGLILGPTIVIHLDDPLYLGIGIDLRVGYLLMSDIDFGVDIYGRIPINLTYYVINNLGILAELGLGYGATGIKYKDMLIPVFDENTGLPKIDFETGEPEMEEIGAGFGTAVQVDFSVGVRFP